MTITTQRSNIKLSLTRFELEDLKSRATRMNMPVPDLVEMLVEARTRLVIKGEQP